MEDDDTMDDSVASKRQDLGDGNIGDASTSLGKNRGKLKSLYFFQSTIRV